MVEKHASDLIPDEKEELYQLLLLEYADIIVEFHAELGRANLNTPLRQVMNIPFGNPVDELHQ